MYKTIQVTKYIFIILLCVSSFTACSSYTIQPSSSDDKKQTITKWSADVSTHEVTITAEEDLIAKEQIPTVQPTPPPIQNAKEIKGLVLLSQLDDSIFIDLKYAGPDNFTGKTVYPLNLCVLHKATAQKLLKANLELKNKGYRLKVLDAYRPVYVQRIFWELVKDERYVANPDKSGSNHNRGTAVDVTLTDAWGKELVMPSKFDDFSICASRNSPHMTDEMIKNMDILTEAMVKCGFRPIQSEWWHFDDEDTHKYPIIDVDLKEFLGEKPDTSSNMDQKTATSTPTTIPQVPSPQASKFQLDHLQALEGCDQAIITASTSFQAATARVYTYERVNGYWKEYLPPFPAVIGKNGFTYNKKEGDQKSPIGAFVLNKCFSRFDNPGTKLDFFQFGKNDYWVDDSSSNYYNTYQKGPSNGRWNSAEDLFKIGDTYKYFLVIEYNTRERVPGKGSAIFLHIWQGENIYTQGCTAIHEDKLLKIIKWLDPKKNPRIIQGPTSEIMNIKTIGY